MASGPTASAPASPPARAVPDLGRLRIERRAEAPPARRGGRFALVLLLALTAFVGWAYATGRLDLSQGTPPVEVTTAVVLGKGGAVVPAGRVTGNGYVIARRRAALSTVLSGRLVEVNVEEGGSVKEGDVVARIQHDDYDAALATARHDVAVARRRKEEAESAHAAALLDVDRLKKDEQVLADLVTAAEAEATRTAADVERNRDLAERRIIDAGRWDALRAAAAAAAAALEAAKGKVESNRSSAVVWQGEIARRAAAVSTATAEVSRAEERQGEAVILLEKSFVRAPFDGLV